MLATVRRTTDSRQGCDFCNQVRAQWRYPCRTFTRTVNGRDDVRLVLAGAWHACEPCHRLIGRGQWGRLRSRTLKRYQELFGTDTATVTAAMSEQLNVSWLGFRENRTGPAVRLGGGTHE
ncbi:hypothetical protein ABZV77_03935 [Streptomyces sp. NPDC004732]|uniref:hypothetical protein n=1 Tax=Streptomyces sp. NPDC004732 TaxID=3154290 RepID=UPI0033AA4ACA